MNRDHAAVHPEFAKLLVLVAAAYPSAKLNEAQIRVYWAALRDVPIERLREACGAAIKESRYFPTVAELRRSVEPSGDDAAVLAWAGLERAVREAGAWTSLEVDDPCTAVALRVAVGSWAAFCELDEGPTLALARQSYIAAYRQARRTATGRQGRPVRLPGLCEASGRYATEALAGRVWTARLTAGGQVEPHRDRPRTALPEAANVRRLTTGEVANEK